MQRSWKCCLVKILCKRTGTIEMDIKVSGMVCDGCSRRVTDALKVRQLSFHTWI